jgi:hypothetical protein
MQPPRQNVACHAHETSVRGFLPRACTRLPVMGPPGVPRWVHLSLAVTVFSRSIGLGVRMAFREVAATEIREVLRARLAGAGLRKAAEQAGVNTAAADAPQRPEIQTAGLLPWSR